MKIAFIVDTFPSISQTFVLNQITGLTDRGHEVFVFASIQGNPNAAHPSVHQYQLLQKVHYWNNPPKHFVKRLLILLRTLAAKQTNKVLLWRSLNVFHFGKSAFTLGSFFNLQPFIEAIKDFDIVHCQFGNLGEKGIMLKQLDATKARLVVSFRGHDLSERWGRDNTYKSLFAKADLVLPVCRYFKEKLLQMGCPSEKIQVHYSGIDINKFAFQLRSFDFKTAPVSIVTVGRLEEKKGVYFALHALKRFRELCSEVPFRYVVAGDGPLLPELKATTKELGLESYVCFRGQLAQDEVVALMQDAAIFLAPHITTTQGDQEGIPNVLKEAMGVGLLVVTTHHSGIPELVAHEKTGFLAPEKDTETLAGYLAQICRTPSNQLQAMAIAAREAVALSFDTHRLNENLVQLYTGVLNRS